MARRLLVGVTGLATAVAVLAPGLAVGRAQTTGGLGFSTPTLLDPFRQGFEPDLAIDPHSGTLYSSVPNGTPGTSTLWRSDDHGHDWRLVEGNLQGEPSNCPAIAGGDTELAVDPVDGSIYYADLQPLTNFNMSVSHDQGRTWQCNPLSVPDSGVDRQWFAIDSDGGTHSVTNGGRMYFDYDDTTQSPSPTPGGNVLVVNATNNGLQFGDTCTGPVCVGPSTRITLNEGLPGNLAVDDNAVSPHQHSVYALHSSADLGAVILTRCDGGGATTAAAAQAYCLDPTATTAPFGLSSHWTDHTVSNTDDVNGVQTHIVANNFCTLAIDTAGNLYALWSLYPGTTDSSNPVSPVYHYTGTGQLLLSHSSDGGTTWSTPVQINPPNLKNNTQPWLTAGSAGRVAVAWYGAPQAKSSDGTTWGPDALDDGVWDVYVAENLNVLGGGPWTVVKATDHPAKLGGISTEGLVLPTGPDRSLGDFMKVGHDSNGAIDLTYVDDNTSLNPGFQNAGPVAFIHQTSGPGLIAGRTVPQVNDTRNTGSVTDPTNDARVPLGGQDLTAPPHLDITASSVKLADPTHLTVTLTVNDPNLQNDLGPDTSLGGATADAWIVRWDFDPKAEPQNTVPGGFFVAMENSQSGGQTFYDGAILTSPGLQNPTLFTFAYPSGNAVTGAVSGDTITWTVPTADVGSPKAGDTLYEVQGITVTQALPSQASGDPTTIGLTNTGGSNTAPNMPDQTVAFDAPLTLASNSSGGSNGGGGSGGAGPVAQTLPNSSAAAAAGPVVGILVLVTAIALVMYGVRRRRLG